ncbi:KxYKxGKxW signal peptide domain-containing protein, partial [Ligilactobacillus faecis]
MENKKRKQRLQKYMTEETRRFKLYKKKKLWVVSSVALFSAAFLLQAPILADEITTLSMDPKTEERATVEDEDSATEKTSETNVTANADENSNDPDLENLEANTPQSMQPHSENSELLNTSENSSETSLAVATSEATSSESTVNIESETSSPVVTATSRALSETAEVKEQKTIKVTNVSADNNGKLSSQIEADGSTKYTYTTDNTMSTSGKIGMNISYTGKNNDTFSMIITPSAAKNGNLSAAQALRPTGTPTVVALANGAYKYTWTISGVADNASATVTQTIPPLNFFSEEARIVADQYWPYVGSSASEDMLVSGDNYLISFLINEQPVSASSNVKIVLAKQVNVTGAEVSTKADAVNDAGQTTVTVDTNYVYTVDTLETPLIAGKKPTARGYVKLQIPVPEHFLLDTDATVKYLKNMADPYLNGTITVSQPGGEGTAIIIESVKPIIFEQISAKLPFIGRYTSTQTSGESASPSGWIDLGDGQKKYFGEVNIDTGTALDPAELNPQARGFQQKVLAKDATKVVDGKTIPAVHENFDLILRYSNSEQTSNHKLTVRNDSYDTLKDPDAVSSVTSIEPVRRTPSEKGDSTAPVLYAVGLSANGLTEFIPTYHFEFPDEITITGITLPLNNVTNDFSDFGSYNPAQVGYTVVVTGSDGTKITQRLQAGDNYDPLTGRIDHLGSFSQGVKLADGTRIVAYDVTPDDKYYANALQASVNGTNGKNALNDINSGYINILGYLNSKAQIGQIYSSKIVVESEYKRIVADFRVEVAEPLKLPVQNYNWPESRVNTANNQTVYKAGDSFVMGFETLGAISTTGSGSNLDASGVLVGKGNATATDLPGHALTVEYGTIKEPVVYFTMPDQTELTDFARDNKFYQVTLNGKQIAVVPPKITQKKNSTGQTVVILDWRGTDFKFTPKMRLLFNLKVIENAINGFDVGRTTETLYAYEDKKNNVPITLYTKAELAKKGISTEGLRAYAANVNSDSNTSWIQLGGDTSQSDIPANRKAQIKFEDGTVADTTMIDAGSNNYYFRIIAPSEVKPLPLIKGTSDFSLSAEGLNYQTKDYLESATGKEGLQKLQFGLANNMPRALENVISVMNLPQAGGVDPNNPNAKQEFTLNISGAGVLDTNPLNNTMHDPNTLYYSTHLVTLSSDGTTLTFDDGRTWKQGEMIPSEFLTADQVTDWSQIKALILSISNFSSENKIMYQFNAYSPTSNDNMSKKVTLRQTAGYKDQTSLIIGDVTDSYATYATVQIVDQAGNRINGYPDIQGKVTLNEKTGEYEVENPGLIGKVGGAYFLEKAPVIKGYQFVNDTRTSPVLAADGSTIITRHYQVDQARLFEGSLTGTKLAEATGDPHANTSQIPGATPTGITEITFNVTDAQLKRPGYTYQIQVVDQTGQALVDQNGNSSYASLAEALSAQGSFDAKADDGIVTQNFIVIYSGDFQKAVLISQNDPQKIIPDTIEKAAQMAPYYNDGRSGEVMFKDSALTDELLKRTGYRYTILAPDGKEYTTLTEALAAKLTFDETENVGDVDKEIQVYRVNYVEDIQKLVVTIIDDYASQPLVENELLSEGRAESEIDKQVKSKYQELIQKYLDQGYEVVSQDEIPEKYDSDATTDQKVVVHLTHALRNVVGQKVTVTQTIDYLYGSGPKKGQVA